MAVIWQKMVKNKRYEVRSAGRTRRLYTNGVLHSQYNPTDIITGSVWDLLMLPALFFPPGHIKRILVLGVGGGAVFHQLNAFVQPDEIVGIELEGLHLQLAKRFFGLKFNNLQLHEADAKQWLKNYNGPPFDMIIDDLFCDGEGEGFRVIPMERQWFRLLYKNISANGVLVANFESPEELRQSSYFQDQTTKNQVGIAYRFETRFCENSVGVFLKKAIPMQQFRRHLNNVPALVSSLKRDRLRFSAKRI